MLTVNDHFFYVDKTLNVFEKILYLVLTLSSRGKFAQTQSNLSDRGLRAMHKLFSDTHELYAPEPSFLCALFDKLVKPVLLYGSEIWGFHKAADVERVHLLFCKIILHLKRNTANYFIYGELGRYPLILDSKIQIIRYWLKTIIYKRNPLAYNVYQTMYNNCENGIATEGWTVSIKSLLFNLGLNFVWYNQGVDNFKAFEYLFKQRLQDADIVQWNNRISNSNDGILYKTYKIKPLYSEYINIITKPSHRYYFLKFVTKNHNLPVVLGKWYQPKPYNERL